MKLWQEALNFGKCEWLEICTGVLLSIQSKPNLIGNFSSPRSFSASLTRLGTYLSRARLELLIAMMMAAKCPLRDIVGGGSLYWSKRPRLPAVCPSNAETIRIWRWQQLLAVNEHPCGMAGRHPLVRKESRFKVQDAAWRRRRFLRRDVHTTTDCSKDD